MTISNHPQSQSNGAKKNGEKAKDREGAKNGEAAKPKQPETAKGAAKAEGPSSETHPKNGAPKADAQENGTAKKRWKARPTQAQEMPRRLRVIGFRGHCEEADHYPTSSLLMPDLDSMKKWVGMMASGLLHANCLWKAEQLFLGEDGRIYSRVGEMDEENPGTAPIEWSEKPPFDLGPLPTGALPELGQEVKGAQAPVTAASKTGQEPSVSPKPESGPAAKTNGEQTKKPIGDGAPAPKPSQSGEHTARAKSRKAKSAPPKRPPTHALRMKSASKHAKRA